MSDLTEKEKFKYETIRKAAFGVLGFIAAVFILKGIEREIGLDTILETNSVVQKSAVGSDLLNTIFEYRLSIAQFVDKYESDNNITEKDFTTDYQEWIRLQSELTNINHVSRLYFNDHSILVTNSIRDDFFKLQHMVVTYTDFLEYSFEREPFVFRKRPENEEHAQNEYNLNQVQQILYGIDFNTDCLIRTINAQIGNSEMETNETTLNSLCRIYITSLVNKRRPGTIGASVEEMDEYFKRVYGGA